MPDNSVSGELPERSIIRKKNIKEELFNFAPSMSFEPRVQRDFTWAGKAFTNSAFPESEQIFNVEGFQEDFEFTPRPKDELRPKPESREVPVVYYRDGIIDHQHRVKIGIAKVYPDGSFTAQLSADAVLMESGSQLGPVSLSLDRVVEVNIDGGENKVRLSSDLVLDDIKESDL